MYLVTWLLFLGVVEYFDWVSARPIEVLVGVLAYPGAVIAALWAIRARKWAYGALAMSALTIAMYLFWWSDQILDRHLTDPGPGIVREILLQFEIATGLSRVLIERSQIPLALCQLYWLLLMPLVQAAFLLPIIRSLGPIVARAEVRT